MCTRNQAFEILKIVYHACDPILGHSIHDAILYGSYARGDFTAESDIDILLTADLTPEQIASQRRAVAGVASTLSLDHDWQSYVQQQKQQELEQIIAEEKLKPAEAQRFVANAFRDGALKTTGTDIDQILPPGSRFGGGNRTEKKKTIIQRLAQFFEKYFGI